jgi:hypothetical protein
VARHAANGLFDAVARGWRLRNRSAAMNRRTWLKRHAAATVCASVGVAGALTRSSARLSAAAGAMAKDLLVSWNDVARKLVEMAEDFPEDRYDWRPAPGVRSFAEQLLHATGFVEFVTANANGLRPNGDDPSRARFRSKAAIVEYVRNTYADGARTVGALSDEQLQSTVDVSLRSRPTASLYGLWDTVVEHSGEHYGQLVVYYRLNNMVPPESRPRK